MKNGQSVCHKLCISWRFLLAVLVSLVAYSYGRVLVGGRRIDMASHLRRFLHFRFQRKHSCHCYLNNPARIYIVKINNSIVVKFILPQGTSANVTLIVPSSNTVPTHFSKLDPENWIFSFSFFILNNYEQLSILLLQFYDYCNYISLLNLRKENFNSKLVVRKKSSLWDYHSNSWCCHNLMM